MTRFEKVRNSMKEQEIDGLIVYSPYNLRYLANFTGTTGFALITLTDAYFVTDARYTQQAQQQAKGFHVIEHKTGWVPAFEKIIRENDLKFVGFEADHVSVSQLEIFEDAFDTALIPTQNIVEKIREVKDEGEIQTIREACRISDAAFLHILDFIKPGVSEIQVANELDFYMRGLGATGVSFDTILEKNQCCKNIVEVAARAMELQGRELSMYEKVGIDHLININLKKVSLLDLSQINLLYKMGYEETKKQLLKKLETQV